MVVGERDPPAAVRCTSGHRQIAAEADQDPAGGGRGGAVGGAVGGEGFGGGAQVEVGVRGQAQPPSARVEDDPVPSGGRLGRGQGADIVGGQGGEGAVVAKGGYSAADSRVDGAVGDSGGTECGLEGLGEACADRCRDARSEVHAGEFGVRPETAAREVDVGQFGPQDGLRGGQSARVGHEQCGRGAEGREHNLGGGRCLGAGGHDAPVVVWGCLWVGAGGCTGGCSAGRAARAAPLSSLPSSSSSSSPSL